eukprot:9051197-Pyramimonas_sp.AAC.1
MTGPLTGPPTDSLTGPLAGLLRAARPASRPPPATPAAPPPPRPPPVESQPVVQHLSTVAPQEKHRSAEVQKRHSSSSSLAHEYRSATVAAAS